MRTRTAPSAALTLAVVLVLALAACAGGTASPAQPSDTPTVAPTPTASPPDVAAAFAERINEELTFVSDLSGTVTVGDIEGTVSGRVDVVGSDVHSLTVIEIPGAPIQENEFLRVDGVTYGRSENGNWVELDTDGSPATRDPITAALADAAALEVVGTEEHDGETLHRIESTSGADISPADLGITSSDITEFEAEVAFLAEDDGTLAGIIFVAAWLQGTQGEPIPAEMELTFLAADRVATIEAPEEVWMRYESAEFGYRMDHPADWDVVHQPAEGEFSPFDLYLGPVDAEIQVYHYPDTGGALSNEWFRASADLLTERGVNPELAETMTLSNGLEVQIFTGTSTEEAGTFFFQQAVIFGGAQAWDLDWYSELGSEAEDQDLFVDFVLSVAPAPRE